MNTISFTPGSTAVVDSAETVIRPRRGWQPLGLAKLWRFRELAWSLAVRDVKVRYKQTVLGAAWAVIQPVTMMVVLTVFLGKGLGLESRTGGVAYPVFLYAGLLPWTFFAGAVTGSANSLVANANMLRKVYFPRLAVPVAAVGVPLLDYAVSSVVLLGLIWWYQVPVTASLLLVPVLAVLTVVAALGVGVGLSGLTVKYRDFRYVLPFLVQVWFFVTPVVWPVSIVPERYQWLLRLNPMGGTIEAFRAAVLGRAVDWPSLVLSALVAGATLVVGLFYFGQVERRFADVA